MTPVTRRPRIVYQVTEAGHREFEHLMTEVGPTAWEDDNFDIRFAFFGRTDMEIRLRVLEGAAADSRSDSIASSESSR